MNEGDGLDEHRKIWLARTPLGRMGGRDELNGAVVLLCSDAARFITGSDIKIDGVHSNPPPLPHTPTGIFLTDL